MRVLLDIRESKALFFIELLRNFSFVKVYPITNEKALLLQEIKEAVDTVNLIKKGELHVRQKNYLMKYNVLTIQPFDRQFKRLVKKFPSLKNEYISLIEKLEQNPEIGTPLANNCFKIRLAIASKGKGKSGGARVITHFYVENDIVFLIAIYDKSEQIDISDKELKGLLLEINK